MLLNLLGNGIFAIFILIVDHVTLMNKSPCRLLAFNLCIKVEWAMTSTWASNLYYVMPYCWFVGLIQTWWFYPYSAHRSWIVHMQRSGTLLTDSFLFFEHSCAWVILGNLLQNNLIIHCHWKKKKMNLLLFLGSILPNVIYLCRIYLTKYILLSNYGQFLAPTWVTKHPF